MIYVNVVYITEVKDDGSIDERYEAVNDVESWTEFKERYLL
jgi:hypothetical protein